MLRPLVWFLSALDRGEVLRAASAVQGEDVCRAEGAAPGVTVQREPRPGAVVRIAAGLLVARSLRYLCTLQMAEAVRWRSISLTSPTRSPRDMQRASRRRSLPGLWLFQVETSSPNGSSTLPSIAITALPWASFTNGRRHRAD